MSLDLACPCLVCVYKSRRHDRPIYAVALDLAHEKALAEQTRAWGEALIDENERLELDLAHEEALHEETRRDVERLRVAERASALREASWQAGYEEQVAKVATLAKALKGMLKSHGEHPGGQHHIWGR